MPGRGTRSQAPPVTFLSQLARVVAAASAVAIPACAPAPGARHASTEHPLLGATAPPLELPTPDRKGQVTLAEHAGKVVMVDFWATWCEPCRKSFPAYQKLLDRAGGKLAVIGVSVDEDPTGIAAFVAETGVRFPVAWDDDQKAAESYAPPSMPTSYTLDANGVVRFVHAGYEPGDELVLEQEITSLY